MDNPHRITEPREMRALAHPLRLRLIGLLRVEGPATATALADTVGESPALVSYHLRQLDAYNFVEEAPELAAMVASVGGAPRRRRRSGTRPTSSTRPSGWPR